MPAIVFVRAIIFGLLFVPITIAALYGLLAIAWLGFGTWDTSWILEFGVFPCIGSFAIASASYFVMKLLPFRFLAATLLVIAWSVVVCGIGMIFDIGLGISMNLRIDWTRLGFMAWIIIPPWIVAFAMVSNASRIRIHFREKAKRRSKRLNAKLQIIEDSLRREKKPLSRETISRLVSRLNSSSHKVAKEAAAELDTILRPDYYQGRGGRVITFEQADVISKRHYGQLRESEAIVPLIVTLKSGNAFARDYAARALGAIGDPRAVPLMIEALSDPDPIVRNGSVHGIGHFREPAAILPLLRLLGDSDTNVVESAAQVLGEMQAKDSVDGLVALASHNDWRLRRCALRALGAILDESVLPIVRNALRDKRRDVRKSAKSALGRFEAVRRNWNKK